MNQTKILYKKNMDEYNRLNWKSNKKEIILLFLMFIFYIVAVEVLERSYIYIFGIDKTVIYTFFVSLLFILLLIIIPIILYKHYKYDTPEVPLFITIAVILILAVRFGFHSYDSIQTVMKSSYMEVQSPDGSDSVIVRSEWIRRRGEREPYRNYRIYFYKKDSPFTLEELDRLYSNQAVDEDKCSVDWNGENVNLTVLADGKRLEEVKLSLNDE